MFKHVIKYGEINNYPANERSFNDIGWLKANFLFSFGPRYKSKMTNFGALRALNDNIIATGRGFSSHPT
jgi:redox-sensitive bicupin YhaK (pirin superfamily)